MADGSPGVLHGLAHAQRWLDRVTNESKWVYNMSNSPFIMSLMPFERSYRWNSSRDAAIFRNRSVLVVGSSPQRELALHLPMLLNGHFDSFQCYPHKDARKYCLYSKEPRGQHGLKPSFASTVLACNESTGCGCHDCYCCCGSHCLATRSCDGNDFVMTSSGAAVRVDFSWKPELLNIEADHNALRSRFCPVPPDIVVLGKGLHETYFWAHTLADPAQRERAWQLGKRWPTNMSDEHISAVEHAGRIESALRRYVPLLRCLPPSTLVVWLTPYHSFKGGYRQARLVEATRSAMMRAHREGILERSVLLDTWSLTKRPGAPWSHDGNHRHPHFQTVVWSLLAAALRDWRGWRT